MKRPSAPGIPSRLRHHPDKSIVIILYYYTIMDQEKMLQLRKSKKIFAACEKWSSLQRRAWITDSAASGGADHLAMLPKRATDDLAEQLKLRGILRDVSQLLFVVVAMDSEDNSGWSFGAGLTPQPAICFGSDPAAGLNSCANLAWLTRDDSEPRTLRSEDCQPPAEQFTVGAGF